MQLGTVLQNIRVFSGFDSKEFAKEIGFSISYISSIENNNKKVSMRILNEYARVAGVKTSTIIRIQEDSEIEKWDIKKLRKEIAKAIYL